MNNIAATTPSREPLHAILMKQLSVITLFTLAIGLLSFLPKRKSGKTLFKENCSSCHAPTKSLTAPPFQKIRDDYGLEWTLRFVKDNQLLMRQKDTKALYIYYLYNKSLQPKFDNLTNDDIVKILDYVDSFPVDNRQYAHRQVSENEMLGILRNDEDKQEKERLQFEKQLEEYNKPLFDTSYSSGDSSSSTRRASGYSSGYSKQTKKKVARKPTSKPLKPQKKKNGM